MAKQITPNPAAGNLDFLTNDMDTKQELQDQPVGEISSDVAVIPESESAEVVVSSKPSILNVVDLSTEEFPDMDATEVAPIDLMSEYWTPKVAGEKTKVVFAHFGEMEVMDQKTNPPSPQMLKCVFFYEKQGEHIKCVSNGSKRLVGALESMHLAQGTMLMVEYLGKKKNSTNSNMSDDWSVKPLVRR